MRKRDIPPTSGFLLLPSCFLPLAFPLENRAGSLPAGRQAQNGMELVQNTNSSHFGTCLLLPLPPFPSLKKYHTLIRKAVGS